jgi:hypothetical protein
MIRNAKESEEHISLIKMMANHFSKLGYLNIRADLPGFTKPEAVQYGQKEFIPDLTCNKNDSGKPVIMEAETCDSIDDTHTRDQWTAFRASANKKNGEFHIVVPISCNGTRARAMTESRLAELGFRADQIWTPSEN